MTEEAGTEKPRFREVAKERAEAKGHERHEKMVNKANNVWFRILGATEYANTAAETGADKAQAKYREVKGKANNAWNEGVEEAVAMKDEKVQAVKSRWTRLKERAGNRYTEIVTRIDNMTERHAQRKQELVEEARTRIDQARTSVETQIDHIRTRANEVATDAWDRTTRTYEKGKGWVQGQVWVAQEGYGMLKAEVQAAPARAKAQVLERWGSGIGRLASGTERAASTVGSWAESLSAHSGAQAAKAEVLRERADAIRPGMI